MMFVHDRSYAPSMSFHQSTRWCWPTSTALDGNPFERCLLTITIGIDRELHFRLIISHPTSLGNALQTLASILFVSTCMRRNSIQKVSLKPLLLDCWSATSEVHARSQAKPAIWGAPSFTDANKTTVATAHASSRPLKPVGRIDSVRTARPILLTVVEARAKMLNVSRGVLVDTQKSTLCPNLNPIGEVNENYYLRSSDRKD